ncbi:MAG: hypothetical protein IJE44_04810 [Clostridia bacterium]|nr:hypothetical protein [Clostridia bacterium]
MNTLYIGIDTSCYTTSLGVMAGDKHRHYKTPLKVKEGECGLRQSDAVFEHIKNLPKLFEEMSREFDVSAYEKKVVSVSSKPRNIEGSYMPVFMAGESFAKSVSAVLNAKLNLVSHQEGHFMSAIYSCGAYSLLSEPFIAVHISGGTTEITIAKWEEGSFKTEIVGGTKDLPAGQFIDRIGVLMGMEFPSGKYLDTMALEYEGSEKVKTSVKDGYINFSGEETRYRRAFEGGESKEKIAYLTMKTIRESLIQAIEDIKKKYGIEKVLMGGGVSSSAFLRQGFENMKDVYFAQAELSTDNAMGVCLLGKFLDN